MVLQWPKYVFLILTVLFVTYSIHIYSLPEGISKNYHPALAAEGRLVWQKYNCQSCHQLFGLGGYLGPDLSNVYSAKGKGPVYINAFTRSGSGQMPAFNPDPNEMNALLEFLKSVDDCGVASPAHFKVKPDGMISNPG
ncbi:MAG: cytochrome c [Bacteroidia bacterium]|nr:cytochrome c [Bacteroidia bacterium]